MNLDVAISGIGLVTPLGRNVTDTWNALLSGQSIVDHARLETPANTDLPRVTALAIEAANQAITQSRWSDRGSEPDQAAIVVGTSKGPIESWLAAQPNMHRPDFTSDNSTPAGRVNSATEHSFGLAAMATEIARAVHLQASPRITLSAACASGLHALIRAALMIQSGVVTRALVVAAEASVHPLFLGSFQRLGVFPPSGIPCRPFDQNRQGFLMSEAAAAICLESSSRSSQVNIPILARIERFSMLGDATHLTASDPDARALIHLLSQCTKDQPLDLIHAHGTGTPFNDPIELKALDHALKPQPTRPSLFSHKAALGHSLGSASLVSVALNCLSHQTSQVPPNINTPNPMPSTSMSIVQNPVNRPIHRSLTCASGFGGPMAAVTLVSP